MYNAALAVSQNFLNAPFSGEGHASYYHAEATTTDGKQPLMIMLVSMAMGTPTMSSFHGDGHATHAAPLNGTGHANHDALVPGGGHAYWIHNHYGASRAAAFGTFTDTSSSFFDSVLLFFLLLAVMLCSVPLLSYWRRDIDEAKPVLRACKPFSAYNKNAVHASCTVLSGCGTTTR